MNNQKIKNLELNNLNEANASFPEWNILEILNNKVYLELKPEFVTFLKDQFKKRMITQKILAKQLNVHPSNLNFWLSSVHKTPYLVIMKFLEILNVDKVALIKNIDGIGLNKGRVKIHSPNIIIKFDTNFARFLGHIYGDGSVRSNFTVSFTNINQDLTNDFIVM